VLEIEASLSGGRMLWTCLGSVKEDGSSRIFEFALLRPQRRSKCPLLSYYYHHPKPDVSQQPIRVWWRI